MSLYEHTIIAKQDVSESQLKQLKSKYLGLIEKFNGILIHLKIGFIKESLKLKCLY